MLEQQPERLADETAVKVLTGWRRLLPLYVSQRSVGWKIQVFPLQLACWAVGLAAGSYLAAGSALYLNDRYRKDLTDISWFDRIYPPNWDQYRIARGKSYIKQATLSLEAGDFSRAFHQLRAGIARAPNDKEGRLLLADMFIAAGRPDLAQSSLNEGVFLHREDKGYISRVLRLLFQRQQDLQTIELAEKLEESAPLTPEIQELLDIAHATALFHRGRFDQAEDILSQPDRVELFNSRILRARIEWQRGFPELALALIDQILVKQPDSADAYRLKISWLIELDQSDSARRESLQNRLRFPNRAQPRIDLLYAFDRAADETAIRKELASIYQDFPENQAVLLQLGDFAANTGRPEVAAELLEYLKVHQFPLEAATLMAVESLIVAEEFHKGLKLAQDTIADNPKWESNLAPIFNGLQAIGYFAIGDREEANLFLDNYLSLQSIRPENQIAVAERLKSVGAMREARRVLQNAVSKDSLNQAALTRLIEFDLQAADAPDLPANLTQILQMRRPPTKLLRDAYDRLGKDRFYFVENRTELLDQLLAALRGKPATS